MKTLLECKHKFKELNCSDEFLDYFNFFKKENNFKNLLLCVFNNSPFLKSLILKEKEWLKNNIHNDIQKIFDDLIRFEDDINVCSAEEIYKRVNVVKNKAILLIALADLGGIWSLNKVTKNLSKLADEILNYSLDNLSFIEIKKGTFQIHQTSRQNQLTNIKGASTKIGLVVLALGKLGSNELNYSSDIDLIFFFDETLYFPQDYEKVRKKFIQLVRSLIKIFSVVDETGIIYRVDLRLRPDPSSNPICIGLDVAERYYESFGRTWERAAFIKARSVAGNKKKGNKFLANLKPFIWRKYLDFNAFNEIDNLREKSLDYHGLKGEKRLKGYNFKLGKGGIRDIEFFAQTNQLAWGGKEIKLRKNSTISALRSLFNNNKISHEKYCILTNSYIFFRKLEHCFQLLNNNQTHSFPVDNKSIKSIILMLRIKNEKKFYKKIFDHIDKVQNEVKNIYHSRNENIFQYENCELDNNPNCNEFTKKWDTYQALRSDKSRNLFFELKPLISKKIFETKRPLETLYHFDRFLSKLPSGIQLFSLFKSNHSILYMIIDIFNAAPSFANYLGNNVSMIDYLLESNFYSPLETLNNLESELSKILKKNSYYEDKLDSCRVWVKEKQFRAGVHLILGISSIQNVSISFSNIAEVCIKCLFKTVSDEFSKKYAALPKVNISIITMGKLASKEMTFTSDLDLIFVYQPFKSMKKNNNKNFSDKVFYSRLSQFFISALTVSTSKGNLYKVDMRLRPSGKQGPVASSLTAFIDYQKNDAWVWEKLALARSRVIYGHEKLKNDIIEVRKGIIKSRIDPNVIKSEVMEMRYRIFQNKITEDNQLEIKYGKGKLLDLELLIQMGILIKNVVKLDSFQKLIKILEKKRFFSEDESKLLVKIYNFFVEMQQITRLIITEKIILDQNNDRYETVFKRYFNNSSLKNIFEKVNLYSEQVNNIFNEKLN